MTNKSIISVIRIRALLLGTLVALAFLITIGLCGLAFAPVFDQEGTSLTVTMRVIVGIGLVTTTVVAFAIASVITCASVDLESRHCAIIYSLGSWGTLSLLLGLPSLLIAMNLGMSFNIRPIIVTDIDVLNTNAITTITLDRSKGNKMKIATEPNPVTNFIAWSMCLSLVLGCGASIAAAQLFYVRQTRRRR